MPDMMTRIGQRDAVKHQVRRDRVNQLPALEERLCVAAGGDDLRPIAKLGGIILGKLLDHAADAVEDALKHRLLSGLSKRTSRRFADNGRQLRGSLVKSIEPHLHARRDGAAEKVPVIIATVD